MCHSLSVCVHGFNQAACPCVAIFSVPRLIPVTQWLIVDVNEYREGQREREGKGSIAGLMNS